MLPNIPHFFKLWWSNEQLYENFEMEVTFQTLVIIKFIHTAWSIDKIEYSLYDAKFMHTLESNGSFTNKNSLPIDVILPKPIVLWKIKIMFVKHDEQLSPFVELRGCFIKGRIQILK